MSKRKYWALLLLALIYGILAIVGCGGSGGQPPAETLASETRFAAMDTLEALQASLTTSTPAEVSTQLAAKMATMPEFSESGVTPDHCAYGRFTDGRIIIFANNRQPASEMASYPVSAPRGRLGGASLIPGKFRLIDTMGTLFQHPAVAMHPTLVAAGMEPAGPIQKGTVEEFKALKDDGFVYLDAHGMNVTLKSGDEVTAIWTATKVTKELDQTYQSMLSAEELVYVVGANDSGKPAEKHYGMTPSFISKYISFGKNSVVFFNACHSGNPDVAKACTSAGAGVYMGWDDSTEDLSAIYAAYYLLDRTLGLYNLEPKPANPGEKQSLDIKELIADMATSKCPQTREVYSTSRATNAKLKFVPGNETLGAIKPIIRDATMDATTGVITIEGQFGETKDTVLQNVTTSSAGVPLTVLTWSSTTITAQGSKGTDSVSVKVGARSSKPQPLGGTFVLSGNQPVGGAAFGPFEVRSKLVVQVNGVEIYADPDGAIRGNRGPLTFTAKKGDMLKILVFTSEIYGGTGEIFLTGPNGTTYRLVAKTLDYIADKTTGQAFQREWDLRYYF
ncbi:MAG: hypothetical protein JNM85_03770 [Chthonomonas sp.]|nr:hypothetical protein [Chthonomonas sp.]